MQSPFACVERSAERAVGIGDARGKPRFYGIDIRGRIDDIAALRDIQSDDTDGCENDFALCNFIRFKVDRRKAPAVGVRARKHFAVQPFERARNRAVRSRKRGQLAVDIQFSRCDGLNLRRLAVRGEVVPVRGFNEFVTRQIQLDNGAVRKFSFYINKILDRFARFG